MLVSARNLAEVYVVRYFRVLGKTLREQGVMCAIDLCVRRVLVLSSSNLAEGNGWNISTNSIVIWFIFEEIFTVQKSFLLQISQHFLFVFRIWYIHDVVNVFLSFFITVHTVTSIALFISMALILFFNVF